MSSLNGANWRLLPEGVASPTLPLSPISNPVPSPPLGLLPLVKVTELPEFYMFLVRGKFQPEQKALGFLPALQELV